MTQEPSGISWEDPPPTARRGGKPQVFTEDIRRALMQRPGEWAKLGRFSTGMAGTLRSRQPDCEFVSRNSSSTDHRADLYARYVGTKESS